MMHDSPDIAHGRLIEGVHIAGYTLERAFSNLEWLLEADRWKQVNGGAFRTVNEYLDGVRLDQFRTVAEQRKRIAQRIKELQPEAAQRKIAKVLGVDHKTIRNDLSAGEKSPSEPPKATESKTLKMTAGENSPPTEMSGAEAAAAVAKAESKVTRGTLGTGESEWYTPAEYLARARDVLGGFDLDPASTALANETVRAGTFFSEETDGLAQEWHGRVWLNPPYAQPHIQYFADKIIAEWQAGRVIAAIMLTHNYTDTTWFQALAEAATGICLKRGRVRFVAPDGELAAPTQGQAFFYFGKAYDRFVEVFADVGFIAPGGGR